MSVNYPVVGRSAETNLRICSHEVGHALVTKALGDNVHFVTVIPDDGFEGKCVRSGATSTLTFHDDDAPSLLPAEVMAICDRLEALGPMEIGTSRSGDNAAYYSICLNNIIALLGGEAAEAILHPDVGSLGTQHDFDEALSFARVAVISSSSPATVALLEYANAEARGIITANVDIARALVEALEKVGTLSGEDVDRIISDAVAKRAAKVELARREDWLRRERNAATFLKGLAD